MPPHHLRVAVVGAGPAGIHAADALLQQHPHAQVDVLEKLPVPYGLVRYGVAPDHPAIKRISESLHNILEQHSIRLMCNVAVGRDISVAELMGDYHAVVVATGADVDADLDVPGHDLPGSHGAAQFVAWYNGHPDVLRTWPLHARDVAVVGAGNVALDITRILAKRADQLIGTDLSDDVYSALEGSAVQTIHLFVRRGPAETRFSPQELRELGDQAGVDVLVDARELVLDDHGRRMVATSAYHRQNLETLRRWADRDGQSQQTSRRRVIMHFNRSPVSIDGSAAVERITVERTLPDGFGHVTGSGELDSYPVQAVYRAVGYRSTAVAGVPFDDHRQRVRNAQGRVLDDAGRPVPGLYVTGWAKRGAAGLIGATRADSRQTITRLLHDLGAGPAGRSPSAREPGTVSRQLLHQRGVTPVDWGGWLNVDRTEVAKGAARGRGRVKIADRRTLLTIAQTSTG